MWRKWICSFWFAFHGSALVILLWNWSLIRYVYPINRFEVFVNIDCGGSFLLMLVGFLFRLLLFLKIKSMPNRSASSECSMFIPLKLSKCCVCESFFVWRACCSCSMDKDVMRFKIRILREKKKHTLKKLLRCSARVFQHQSYLFIELLFLLVLL